MRGLAGESVDVPLGLDDVTVTISRPSNQAGGYGGPTPETELQLQQTIANVAQPSQGFGGSWKFAAAGSTPTKVPAVISQDRIRGRGDAQMPENPDRPWRRVGFDYLTPMYDAAGNPTIVREEDRLTDEFGRRYVVLEVSVQKALGRYSLVVEDSIL